MNTLKIKTGDMVVVRNGAEKGKTGKVTTVMPKTNQIVVQGVNVRTRHRKPSQAYPQGGVFEEPKPIDASKVGLVHPSKKGQASRVSYKLDSKGNKSRVYVANGKEIK